MGRKEKRWYEAGTKRHAHILVDISQEKGKEPVYSNPKYWPELDEVIKAQRDTERAPYGETLEYWKMEDEEDADLGRQGVFPVNVGTTIGATTGENPNGKREKVAPRSVIVPLEDVVRSVLKHLKRVVLEEISKRVQEEYVNASGYLYEGQDETPDETPDEENGEHKGDGGAYSEYTESQRVAFARLATPHEIMERNREAMHKQAKELRKINDEQRQQVAFTQRELQRMADELLKTERPMDARGIPLPKIDPRNTGNDGQGDFHNRPQNI